MQTPQQTQISKPLPSLQRLAANSKHKGHAVLALDPGQTTGAALHNQNNDAINGVPLSYQFRYLSLDQFAVWITNTIEITDPDVIVVESYRIYPSKADLHIHSDVPVAQQIGMIRYVASYRMIPVCFQTAATAKTFVTDGKLKRSNLYLINQPHAMDALRHLYAYLILNKEMLPEPKLKLS